jgi:hypothetical protein
MQPQRARPMIPEEPALPATADNTASTLRVFTSGYGFSGSSAVVDLLRDQTDLHVFPHEFDFLRVHGIPGIVSRSIKQDAPLLDDVARFLRRADRMLSLRALVPAASLVALGCPIPRVNRVAPVATYRCLLASRRKWLVARRTRRMVRALGQRTLPISKTDAFVNALVGFVEEWLHMYEDCNVRDRTGGFVYDQPLDPANHAEFLSAFSARWRFILVDRDVRDQYVDMVANLGEDALQQRAAKRLKELGRESVVTGDVRLDFGAWQARQRVAWRRSSRLLPTAQYLELQFEDLVENPETAGRRILSLLGDQGSYSADRENRFRPELSRRNAGRFRRDLSEGDSTRVLQAFRAELSGAEALEP